MNSTNFKKSQFSNQLNDIPKLQKVIIAIIILVVVILVWYFSYFDGLLSKSSRLEAEVAQLNEFEKKLPLEVKKYADVSQKLDLYKQMLPEKEEIPSLLVNIHSTISNIGLTMNKFSPTTSSQGQNGAYIAIPIQVSATGTFDQIGNAFEALEKLTRLVKITDFTVTASSTKDLLNVDFKAETYSLSKANQTSESRNKT